MVYQDTSHWTNGKGSYATQKVEYSHDLFIQEALNYIDHQQDDPFFLYLPLTILHNNGEALEGERQEVPDLGTYANQPYLPEASAAIGKKPRATQR